MNFSYSEVIQKFQDQLGTPKELIEETFNKSDATDIVSDRCVAIKRFGDFYILVTYGMDGNYVRFLNAYRIYPELLEGIDIRKLRPVQVLKEFMNRYGISKAVPGFGEVKVFIEKTVKVMFLGILDIDKYVESVRKIGH
jgi:hypothetical protein